MKVYSGCLHSINACTLRYMLYRSMLIPAIINFKCIVPSGSDGLYITEQCKTLPSQLLVILGITNVTVLVY